MPDEKATTLFDAKEWVSEHPWLRNQKEPDPWAGNWTSTRFLLNIYNKHYAVERQLPFANAEQIQEAFAAAGYEIKEAHDDWGWSMGVEGVLISIPIAHASKFWGDQVLILRQRQQLDEYGIAYTNRTTLRDAQSLIEAYEHVCDMGIRKDTKRFEETLKRIADLRQEERIEKDRQTKEKYEREGKAGGSVDEVSN